jgi:predicted nicotinamide N-methyase
MLTLRSLELGAGGGLVGLAIAIGCSVDHLIYITDQENMFDLMGKNISLNGLESRVEGLVLNWYIRPHLLDYSSDKNLRGESLPPEVLQQKPNVILAADCVYFEPAFPLLLSTLGDLLELCREATIYFCFKKRRRADMQFMKNAKKRFVVEEIEDQDRETFSREGLFLYTFKRKP